MQLVVSIDFAIVLGRVERATRFCFMDDEAIVYENEGICRVFISYKWSDAKLVVRGIADELKNTGKYDVWIDIEEMFGDKNARMEEVGLNYY